jgi:hypothetical protein
MLKETDKDCLACGISIEQWLNRERIPIPKPSAAPLFSFKWFVGGIGFGMVFGAVGWIYAMREIFIGRPSLLFGWIGPTRYTRTTHEFLISPKSVISIVIFSLAWGLIFGYFRDRLWKRVN